MNDKLTKINNDIDAAFTSNSSTALVPKIPAKQLKAERAIVDHLAGAHSRAEAFFGDRTNLFAVKQLARYHFDDERGEREFVADLSRAQDYAVEIFANERPTPEEVFFVLDALNDEDGDEDEDEE